MSQPLYTVGDTTPLYFTDMNQPKDIEFQYGVDRAPHYGQIRQLQQLARLGSEITVHENGAVFTGTVTSLSTSRVVLAGSYGPKVVKWCNVRKVVNYRQSDDKPLDEFGKRFVKVVEDCGCSLQQVHYTTQIVPQGVTSNLKVGPVDSSSKPGACFLVRCPRPKDDTPPPRAALLHKFLRDAESWAEIEVDHALRVVDFKMYGRWIRMVHRLDQDNFLIQI